MIVAQILFGDNARGSRRTQEVPMTNTAHAAEFLDTINVLATMGFDVAGKVEVRNVPKETNRK